MPKAQRLRLRWAFVYLKDEASGNDVNRDQLLT